jgi:hypothetical protein
VKITPWLGNTDRERVILRNQENISLVFSSRLAFCLFYRETLLYPWINFLLRLKFIIVFSNICQNGFIDFESEIDKSDELISYGKLRKYATVKKKLK